MRNRWEPVELGALCEFVKGNSPTQKTPPGPYPLIVTGPDPLSSDSFQFDGEAVCVPMVSSTGHGHASLKRVHYASGKFAVANIVTACVVRDGEMCDTKFLWHFLHHFKDDLIVSRMKGTANVSLSVRELGKVPIILPPPAEQRRIVDLITAIDDARAAVEDIRIGASRLLDSVREESYVTGPKPLRPLGALAVMRSGPSWKATDESPSKKEGYAPVLGITNTPAGRGLDLSQQKFVRGLSGTVMRLNDSSLIMIRTNGNRARIGNVYRATAAVAGYAVSAFQITIEPRRVADSPFLYWILGTPSIQQRISKAASGSTGLGNVAIGWLKELVVPYSEGSVQLADFVETCEAIAAVADEAQVEANSLQVLRSESLTALLSGEHAIPESYDELIGA